MAKYTIQRILAMLLTMFIILTVGFMVIRLMPGGIFDDAVDMTHEQRAALEAKYNLDKPIIVQYGLFLKGLILEGDWGTSLKMNINVPVWDIIKTKIPVTLYINFFSLLISLPLIMGSLGNPDQLGNLLGLGVLLLLLGLAVLFSKFRRKENPYERAARDLLSHARDFQRDTQAEALLFLPEGIGYTVPEGVELSEPGLLDYGKLEAMVETADLWLMVAEQKGMILQKQEFQGDPDSFRTFLQEKGVRIIPV